MRFHWTWFVCGSVGCGASELEPSGEEAEAKRALDPCAALKDASLGDSAEACFAMDLDAVVAPDEVVVAHSLCIDCAIEEAIPSAKRSSGPPWAQDDGTETLVTQGSCPFGNTGAPALTQGALYDSGDRLYLSYYTRVRMPAQIPQPFEVITWLGTWAEWGQKRRIMQAWPVAHDLAPFYSSGDIVWTCAAVPITTANPSPVVQRELLLAGAYVPQSDPPLTYRIVVQDDWDTQP